MSITTVVEGKRGCGYRKPGGLYLRVDGRGWECGALPIPLDVCPCCGEGIKPSRGWTWIDMGKFAAKRECARTGGCGPCPLADAMIGRAGLLWVGEQFYPTPEDWLKEASQMGISRRIKSVPHGFKVGETWVAMAHRKAIKIGDDKYQAAIFHVFCPSRIEYVVKGTETDEEIATLEKRGFTLVKVEHAGETQALV